MRRGLATNQKKGQLEKEVVAYSGSRHRSSGRVKFTLFDFKDDRGAGRGSCPVGVDRNSLPTIAKERRRGVATTELRQTLGNVPAEIDEEQFSPISRRLEAAADNGLIFAARRAKFPWCLEQLKKLANKWPQRLWSIDTDHRSFLARMIPNETSHNIN